MARSGTRSQPSHYPFFAFHLVRTCSLISSAIVSAILLYFCYHLKHDHYKIPWTFLVLLAVSVLTLITLVLTFLIHICHTLSPRLSMLINVPLLILWLVGLGLLAWNLIGTLAHTCDIANWGNETGVMICRTYKALFSFAVISAVLAVASVILDFRARKEQVRQGAYDQMADPLTKDVRHPSESDLKFAGMNNVTTDISMEPYRHEGHRPDVQEVHHNAPHQDYNREDYTMQQFGYNAPAEQTRYDAGSYGYDGRH